MRQEQIVKFSTPAKNNKIVSTMDFNKLVARIDAIEEKLNKADEVIKPILKEIPNKPKKEKVIKKQ